MSNDVARQKVLSYLQAYFSGDIEKALSCCDEEIDVISYAPVEIFPHLGHRHGKAELGGTLTATLKRYSSVRHEMMWIAADGDKVSAIVRLFMRKVNSERVVQFDLAMFFTLRQGRIAELRSFFDTFDTMQQILGHDLTDAFASTVRRAIQS